MNESTIERAQLICDFFDNYPREAEYDDVEAVSAKLTKMRDAVVALRTEAIARHSVAELREVQTLDAEFAGLFNMLRRRQAAKALSNGIQVASSVPDAADLSKWRK